MPFRSPDIPCSRCGGIGTVPLPPHLTAVLENIFFGTDTTAGLVEIAKLQRGEVVTVPAMCNRVAVLLELSLITRCPDKDPTGGRLWRYAVKGSEDD